MCARQIEEIRTHYQKKVKELDRKLIEALDALDKANNNARLLSDEQRLRKFSSFITRVSYHEIIEMPAIRGVIALTVISVPMIRRIACHARSGSSS